MEVAQTVSEYERERGKPMPSRNHGLVQYYLVLALSRYDQDYSVIPELSLELAGRPMVPDLSVYPKLKHDWRHDEVKMTEPPLLVIEIMSPTQGMEEVVLKAEAYLEAGVKACWIVQPALEAIAVMDPGAKPKVFTSGELTDPATGISITVEEIFR